MLYQGKNSVGNYSFECLKYINFSYVPHLHKHIEIVYVEKGVLEVTYNDSVEIMKAGDFALIPSYRVHSYSTKTNNVCYVCVLSEDLVSKFSKELCGRAGHSAVFKCDSCTEKYVRTFLFENNDRDIFTIKASLYAICACYMKSVSLNESRMNDNLLLHQILNYISDNFTSDITLAGMSEKLRYEKHYLSRFIHENLNMNFKYIVNSNRVDKAKELLSDGNLTMRQIAEQSGFQSVRTFNRVFKEFTGVQPGKI